MSQDSGKTESEKEAEDKLVSRSIPGPTNTSDVTEKTPIYPEDQESDDTEVTKSQKDK